MDSIINFTVAQNYADISPLFDRAYNSPKLVEGFTHEDFRKELLTAYDAIQNKLAVLGEFDAYGKRDFSTGRDWFINRLSRTVGIVVQTKKMMVPVLIPLIHEALRTLSDNYVTTINGEMGPGEDFYITVEKNGNVTGYAKNPEWLKPFGFLS